MKGGELARGLVTARRGASATAVAFRFRRKVRVAVVVKATFAFEPGGVMQPALPEPILRSDVRHEPPLESLRLSHDLVPSLPRAEVLITGHACAIGGLAVTRQSVRFALFDGRKVLLDKALLVREPEPFTRVPLVYERAYGGAANAENPVGTGALRGSTKPSIFDPTNLRRPAGFGPIAPSWPVRALRLGSFATSNIDADLPTFPDDFDWSYFHAAPSDQQVDALRGDEEILLAGMHAEHAELRMRLPGARAEARIERESKPVRVLELGLETLRIDADAEHCTLVFRGRFSVANQAELDTLRIEGGVILGGATSEWNAPAISDGNDTRTVLLSESLDAPASSAPSSERRAAVVSSRGTTIRLEEEPRGVRRVPDATPFKRADSPWAAVDAVPPLKPRKLDTRETGTVHLSEDDQLTAADRLAMPWSSEPAPDRRHFDVVAASPPRSKRSLEPAMGAVLPPLPPDVQEPPAWIGVNPPPEKRRVAMQAPASLATAIRPARLVDGAFAVVVAKAVCDLCAREPAVVRAQATPLSGDVRFEDDLAASLRYASDFAVAKRRADVTLIGHACAPSRGARGGRAWFRFGHPRNAFDLRIDVHGDRFWRRAKGTVLARISEAEPFDVVPLRYEFAFGGPDFQPNPMGRAHAAVVAEDGTVLMPNLEDPDSPIRSLASEPEPACFAPLALAQKRNVRESEREQAAPRRQQLAFLRGDEPFEIGGVLPFGDVLAGSLPGVRVHARADRAGGTREDVPMNLDTVAFDVDEKTVSLVFRGLVRVADETDILASVAMLAFSIEPVEPRR